jgi:hypothetical protein
MLERCRQAFCEHPASVNESYWQHMGQALWFSATMFAGAIACLIHAVFPFLCIKTGSGFIAKLNDRMVVNRMRNLPNAARLPAE